MARIRADKPESYQSETLAEISLAAERTFKGMATIADDRGRLPDKPAQINGDLWAMRSERHPHTKEDLETELAEMVETGLICRYTGCDGKRYIHHVSWDRHQKIDRPSRTRLPRCPQHRTGIDYCGLHDGECPVAPMPPVPGLATGSRGLDDDSRVLQQAQNGQHVSAGGLSDGDGAPSGAKSDSEWCSVADLQERLASRQAREASMLDLGSRTMDLGSRTRESARARQVPNTPPQSRPAELPDDFAVTDAMRRWAHKTYPGLDLDFETEQFKRYHRSQGTRRKSWVDAWQKWIADSWKHAQKSTGSSRSSPSKPPRQTNFSDEEYISGWS